MPSTYTSSLRLTLPATGELSGTWGTTVNTGITELTDAAIAGYASVAMTDADYTLTVANGATDQARRMMLNMTGTLTGARNVICPTASKLYVIKNATTGGFAITLKTSAGTGISIPNGSSMLLMCDGTNVVDAVTQFSSGTFTNLAYTGTLTGGTGVVNLGSGQVYKDASGNVGIGTGAPSQKLEVSGASGSNASIRASTAGSNASPKAIQLLFTGVSTDGATPETKAYVYSQDNTIDSQSSFLSFGTRNGATLAERMRLDASGNLGIGTSSPGAKLNVYGTTKIGEGVASNTSKLMVDTISGVAAGIQLLQDGNESWIMEIPASSTALRWAASGVEYMRLNYTGLGIGTTSPSSKLDVVVADAATSSKWIATTGRLRLRPYADATLGAIFESINTAENAYLPLSLFGSTVSLGNGAQAIIDSSGNLGLGVVPSAWGAGWKALQVGALGFMSTPSGANSYLMSNAYYDGASYKYVNSLTATKYDMAAGVHAWFTAPSGTAGNAISFTQAMTLDASGNLGVGTSSPASYPGKLAVEGNMSVATGGKLYQFDATNSTGRYMQALPNSELSIGKFGAVSDTEQMRLDSSGNVGIGTSSPGFPLEVRKDQNAGTRIGVNNQNSGANSLAGIVLQAYGGDWKLDALASATFLSPLRFVFNTEERMRLSAEGNLGIGAVSPGARLHVNNIGNGVSFIASALSETASQINIGVGVLTAGRPFIGTNTSTNPLEIGTRAAIDTVFVTNSTERMRIDSSGNLGLGVTPSAWWVNDKAAQVLGGAVWAFNGDTANVNLSANVYQNSSNAATYIGTGTATRYAQETGAHKWFTAPSGTAGNAISFTQAMTLDASGNLGVGTTSPTNYGAAFRTVSVNGTSGGIFEFKVADVTAGYMTADASALSILAGGSRVLSLYTNGTEKARIDSSGNLLVGTTSAIARISVENSSAGDGITVRSNGINTNKAGTTNALLLGCDYTTATSYVVAGGSGTNTTLAFYTAAAAAPVERARIDSSGNLLITGSGGLGYGTGSGGSTTQLTSRTTLVTINKTNGAITLVSAAGTTAWQSFTVQNTTVAATDTVIVSQKSGTDLYQIFVTAVAAGSFRISFATTGGATIEQPIFNFAVIKAVIA